MHYKKLFEDLLKDHLGYLVHSIHLVNRIVFYQRVDERLRSVNLSHLQRMEYDSNYSYKPANILNNSNNISGVTIFTLENNIKKPVIFLLDEIQLEDHYSEEFNQEFKSLLHFLGLLHELAHVKDFHDGINFESNNYNLLNGEIYAHSFVLNYCNSIGENTARNTYAEAISRFRDSPKEFNRKVYQGICEKIGKGRVKKWSKA